MRLPETSNVHHVYTPPPGPVDYLHVDEHLIAINKPAGLLSVPGRAPEKADCAISRVARDYPEVLTVHRLDMSTSGLLLLARSKAIHRALSLLFERGRVGKAYIADVWGTPDPANGAITAPLMVDWPNKPRQKIDLENGKPSHTDYATREMHTHGARVELAPKTGRTHQLRIHLASIGHPILGDEFYAHQPAFDAAPRLHLHATQLSFIHPATQTELTLNSPCPF